MTATRALLELRVPGDKSISHRALMLAALAHGESRLRGLLAGADTQATAAALRALGVAVPSLADDGAELIVRGVGLNGLRAPADVLDCANSGTSARLLCGVLAGQEFEATLTGDASLRSRPMRRVTAPLARMGARFVELGDADRLPLRVSGGRLAPIEHVNEPASAQVKSAILLAGLTGTARVEVRERVATRDHTERLLQAMGARIRVGADGAGRAIALEPVEALDPLDLDVPGDFSSAAFLLAFALLHPAGELRLPGVGLNATRTGLLAALERMGANVDVEDAVTTGGERAGALHARGSRLGGTVVRADEIPALVDEVPVITALGARADGATRIEGAAELRVKESDRIAALVVNLRAVGAHAEELPDGLLVQGGDAPLRGRVHTRGDHRIAMAFGVLRALPGNEIEIDDADCVSVSYPGFWDAVQTAAAAFGR